MKKEHILAINPLLAAHVVSRAKKRVKQARLHINDRLNLSRARSQNSKSKNKLISISSFDNTNDDEESPNSARKQSDKALLKKLGQKSEESTSEVKQTAKLLETISKMSRDGQSSKGLHAFKRKAENLSENVQLLAKIITSSTRKNFTGLKTNRYKNKEFLRRRHQALFNRGLKKGFKVDNLDYRTEWLNKRQVTDKSWREIMKSSSKWYVCFEGFCGGFRFQKIEIF